MYRLSEGLIRILLSVGPAFRNLMLIQMLKGAAQIVLLFPAVKSQISPTTRQYLHRSCVQTILSVHPGRQAASVEEQPT
ncbi:hypothetical protein WJX77_001106 [Trebouxia sp. C0004]